ncbi:MAG TPA: universal stress protein [Candidatus Acidoferrales bacterium]|nr:universal stress protein [Candidatus Acidoferrales bacterium]
MLPPKLILSPIDFSDPSHEALDTAADLAAYVKSELLLVHVVAMLPRLPSPAMIFNEAEFERELHKDAEKRLNDLVNKLAAKGLKARLELGTANDVAMEIIRIGEHNKADLIVIATHGTTGWHRLAFGSVTEKVVRLAALPVLVLRADAERKTNSSAPEASATAGGR